MYLRLAHARINPELISDLQRTFDEKIIPRLEGIPGCLYICVIAIEPKHDEGFSITLWDSMDHLKAYDQSAIYQENLGDVKPYMSASSEQKIQLSNDMKLELITGPEEPTVKAYESLAQIDAEIPSRENAYLANLRFLTIKIQPGKMEEIKHIYTDEIIPVLRTVKGCEYACLIEGLEERNEAISITCWDSKRNMDNYEQSGLFNELNNKVKHTFTGLYRWKMEVDNESRGKAMTSEDQTIQYYSIVTGKSFK